MNPSIIAIMGGTVANALNSGKTSTASTYLMHELERLTAEHPGIEIIPADSGTVSFEGRRFIEPTVLEPYVIDCNRFDLPHEVKARNDLPGFTRKGSKNLSPSRVARRRAKNKAARKARRRNSH